VTGMGSSLGGRDDEAGAAAAEHVAMVTVVGAVIAALFAVQIGPTVGAWGRYAVCSLFGDEGGCERPDGTADGGVWDGAQPITLTCLERSDREAAGGSVTLFSVKVNSDLTYRVDRLSDGIYEVELEVAGGVGGELMSGGRLSADELGITRGSSYGLSATAEGAVAPVYTFETEREAVEFAESARELVAGPARDTYSWRSLMDGPLRTLGRVGWNQYNRVRDFEVGTPTRLRIEGGLNVAAEGSRYGTGGGIEGVLAAGRTVGGEIDLGSGGSTVFVALDGEIAAQLGFGPVLATPAGGNVQADGSLSGEVVIGLTFDRDLTPTRLDLGATISGVGGIQGGAFTTNVFDGGPFGGLGQDLDRALASGDLSMREGDRSFALTTIGSLDLTDPRLAETGDSLLSALAERDGAALRDAGADLGRHLRDDTDVEIQLHTGSQDSFDLSASGGQGWTFGFGVNHQRSDTALAGAWARPAGGAFGRASCG
jgi:hypothetical protein